MPKPKPKPVAHRWNCFRGHYLSRWGSSRLAWRNWSLGEVRSPLAVLLLLPALTSCGPMVLGPRAEPLEQPASNANSTAIPVALDPAPARQELDPSLPTEPSAELLQESWEAYRQRFIQADGRVIDWEAEGRSTSESQAYAMLRAVFADDPETFARTLKWAEDNLARPSSSQPNAPLQDQLWSWTWGKQGDRWGVMDANFAIDADIDAVTALILAHRRWDRPEYLALAQEKLSDIWDHSTFELGDQRYLLPGPKAAFVQLASPESGDASEGQSGIDQNDPGQNDPGQNNIRLQLNPSYFAPYAFRLFQNVNPERNWLSLVDSSYQVLEGSAALSAQGLPGDWIEVTAAGTFQAITPPSQLSSHYSFDAYRVWWRIALDAIWYDAPEARQYLTDHLDFFTQAWQREQRIWAKYSLDGKPMVNYDATSQYGMLYPAFELINPAIAAEIFQLKLLPRYRDGLWDDESAYYSQNLAWLGLFPFESISATVR